MIEQDTHRQLQSVGDDAVTPDVGRHVMLINQGSANGVKVGMAVIGQEGGSPTALVGVVDQVDPASARVLLISDFSSEVSAKVYHEGTVADGVIQGQFQRGGWLRLEEVDRAVPLAAGDQVVTAGLTAQMDLDLPHGAIPRNISIGVVERVWTEGYRQFAEMRPYLAPDQVRYAWVILSHDE
ncbi:MAG: rod shape-determining protein MreC [Roseiflexaceae bacterium]|nr:rod shape-determining protein MreC [Roseiflexaceae bacterium]